MTTVDRAQRAQRGDRGDLRRLPGHRQSAVRRCALRRELRAVGGQLDQLRAGRWRRSSITSPPVCARRAAARAVSLQRADRKFRQYLSRARRRAPWACRSTRLVIATNAQRHPRRVTSATGGHDQPVSVVASLSPSMDIQVASNFERLLFELAGRDARRVDALMRQFREDGRLPPERDRAWRTARAVRAHGSTSMRPR